MAITLANESGRTSVAIVTPNTKMIHINYRMVRTGLAEWPFGGASSAFDA
jgi:hypothetical protein